MALFFTMSLRSFRVELDIERGGTVRLDRQFPFLNAQYRMPGLHAVGTGGRSPMENAPAASVTA